MREVKESKKREKKRRGERKEGKEVAFVRKMRTAHFRGDACKNVVLLRFITRFGCSVTLPVTFAMRRFAAV